MAEFSQVVSGQRFDFPAELYNRLIDSVVGNLTRHQQPQGLPLSSQFTKGESAFVKVFNNSGQDIREFSPIGLGGLEFTPGKNPGDGKETDFLTGLFIFSGELPNESLHNLKFGITQERILDQGVGIVKISGETIARILVASPGNPDEVKRVGINTGDINYLFEAPYGAEVLFIDSTEIENETNAYWALIKMGRLQPISNIPGKAKAAIASGATGKIVETLADLTEKGRQFDAVNFGPAVSNNGQILWGVDRIGQPFFRETSGGAACGAGDCPDSCEDILECFEVFWEQNMDSGSFFIPITIESACIPWLAPGSNPIGFDGVTDPTTGRIWELNVEWDVCAQIIIYTLSSCVGAPEPIDPDFGGTISAPACGSDIDILITPVGTCGETNTFPCCNATEGCTCP